MHVSVVYDASFVSPDTHTLASRAETPRALYRDGAMT